MSAYRLPLHTVSGAFSTLLALIPWEILKASGVSEEAAAYTAAAILLVAAVAALAIARRPIAQREWHVRVYSETFSLPAFLAAFGGFALAELALALFVLVMLAYSM